MDACQKCESLLDDYSHATLEEDELIFIETHLAGCERCQAQWQERQHLDEMLRRWAEEEIEPQEGFREALFARLEMESAPISLIGNNQKAQKKKAFFYHKVLPLAAAAILLLALAPTVLTSLQGKSAEGGQMELARGADANMANTAEVALYAAEPSEAMPQDAPEQTKTVPKEDAEKNEAVDAPSQQPLLLQNPPKEEQPAETENHPMLASEPMEAPSTDNTVQPRIRSAMDLSQMEPDWAMLQQEKEQLLEQYRAEIAQLHEQYTQEPTTEIQSALDDLEIKQQNLEAQLAAIEAKDALQYQSLLQEQE